MLKIKKCTAELDFQKKPNGARKVLLFSVKGEIKQLVNTTLPSFRTARVTGKLLKSQQHWYLEGVHPWV
ncbi:MAG: hypothetical protein H6557_08025 [Lewinellaceae bacterium]|nr:hypothetical protein [Lewinellaceae bacterium]